MTSFNVRSEAKRFFSGCLLTTFMSFNVYSSVHSRVLMYKPLRRRDTLDIHSSGQGGQAHRLQEGGHGERVQHGGPMSSQPPTLPLEEVPRLHTGDTTGGAGDIGGTEANRAASRGEILATICTACMAPWCSDGPHRILSEGLHFHGSQCILFATFLLFRLQPCRFPLGLGAISTRTV